MKKIQMQLLTTVELVGGDEDGDKRKGTPRATGTRKPAGTGGAPRRTTK